MAVPTVWSSRSLRACLVPCLGVILGSGEARAGGIEVGSVGVASVGRAGAFAARASDPTAMFHNVAGIVGLPGFQWTASANLGFWSHCFQREGRYDGVESGVETRTTVFADSRYARARPGYPEVCNEPATAVVPQLLATYRPTDWLAFGAGLLTPAGLGAQRFPDQVQTPAGLAPSPARYMVLATGVVIVNPTVAVAVAPTRWLRFGAALQPSFGRFTGETMANAIGSQSPATDVRTQVDATAFFFAGNLGLMVQPTSWLTIGFHAHLNDGPVVFRGNATATARPYAADLGQRHRSTFETEVTLPLPNLYRVGIRYASVRDGAPADNLARDPMRDEVFDLELDLHYENSSALAQVVTRNRGIVETEPGMGAPATPEVILRRNWRDTWGFRLGGDYNVVPNVFSVRAGVSWDLGAQTGPRVVDGNPVAWNPNAGIDTTGYDNLGLSAGASLRWRWLTVDLAYQHLFVGGQDVVRGSATTVSGTVPITAADCARGPGYPGPGACTNNQGSYTGSYDLLSIGITGRH